MNTIERLNKFINDSGIVPEMAYSEACTILSTIIENKALKSAKIIETFKEIGMGTMYECPHCNGSHTLIEFGACHWCGEELAAPNTSLKQKAAVEKKEVVAEEKPAVEEKVKKTRKTKKEVEAVAEEKPAVTVKLDAKPAKPVVLKANKYHSQRDSLESGLAQAKNKENKHAALCKLAEDFSLEIPRPDVTTSSILRAQIINELEKLIAALPAPEVKVEKKSPKVVEVTEEEIEKDLDDEELTFDDEEDDETVVSSSDEEDEEDAEEKPKKSKKSDKKEDKKPAKKAVVKKDEEEDDEEIDFDLDDDDKKLDEVEVEDDEFDLEDDGDIED